MTDETPILSAIYDGWHHYQDTLVQALAPLTAEQLALRAAPRLRSVGEVAAHVIGARARWFQQVMGEGGDEFAALSRWDIPNTPARSTAELIHGLEATWQGMQTSMLRWTAEEWQQTWPGEYEGDPEVITRPWIIWHLVEHDVHHGGEISLTLGVHGVQALDL